MHFGFSLFPHIVSKMFDLRCKQRERLQPRKLIYFASTFISKLSFESLFETLLLHGMIRMQRCVQNYSTQKSHAGLVAQLKYNQNNSRYLHTVLSFETEIVETPLRSVQQIRQPLKRTIYQSSLLLP